MEPEKLIGKKVRGFKFDKPYYVANNMDSYVDKIGTIESFTYGNQRVVVDFGNSNSWIYPADQIEAHLVEDEIPADQIEAHLVEDEIPTDQIEAHLVEDEIPTDQIEAHLVEDEIPTLTDGVMMFVSDDFLKWEKKEVLFKINNMYITREFVPYIHCKPLEPTKEEQLKAILGSDEKVSEIMELFKN